MKSAPPKFGKGGFGAEAPEMDCSGPVFGMPLDVIMMDQGKGHVPFVVLKTVDFLMNFCMFFFLSPLFFFDFGLADLFASQ